jgi:pyridoxamine 5'-phosphate oxidase
MDLRKRNPIEIFEEWFAEAKSSEPTLPDAMNVATVGSDGRPSNRTVLLKDVSEAGFVFFTNKRSRKGKDIAQNAQVALCIYWKSLQRQVRIEGVAQLLSEKENDDYWATRPRGSKLGAWASEQSAAIKSREDLDAKFAEVEQRFEGQDEVPRPSHWGGFRVTPTLMEFWENRDDRMHDRCEFLWTGKSWYYRRLQP